MADLDVDLDGLAVGALSIYDVAKVLPHPYNAVGDMANKWAHDYVDVALRVKAALAERDEEISRLKHRLDRHEPKRWEIY